MALNFKKYHGLGNDFIILDRREEGKPLDLPLVKKLCDRHFGIGADGILSLLPPVSKEGEFYMHIANSDGSIAEMCGNGIRCFVNYLYDLGLIESPEVKIDTDAGIMKCRFEGYDERGGFTVTVNMGMARFSALNLPREEFLEEEMLKLAVAERIYNATPVSMGNPHAVIFTEQASASIARGDGPKIEKNPLFPEGANIEFVKYRDERSAEVYVWERGAGITLACGTGACAVAAAGVKRGLFKPGEEIRLKLPGGELYITVEEGFQNVFMRGPSEKVFEGVCYLT
ncbi:MAG: diaminopimelate epimerase [Myxococcota bacterium]